MSDAISKQSPKSPVCGVPPVDLRLTPDVQYRRETVEEASVREIVNMAHMLRGAQLERLRRAAHRAFGDYALSGQMAHDHGLAHLGYDADDKVETNGGPS